MNGRTLFRMAALAVALCMLLRTLARTDLHGAGVMIAHSGPAILIALLPFAIMMGIDAFVQKRLLETVGQSARYRALYFVRFITEALSISLPAGVLFAESTGPLLLQRNYGLSIDAAIVANTTKRWLTIRAHAVYLALSAVLGCATLTRVSSGMAAGPSLLLVVVVLSAALFAISLAVGAVLAGRKWPERLARRLCSLPIARLRAWIERSHASLESMGNRFARVTSDKGTLALATLMLLSSWLVESVESWLILRLLGAPLGFAEVIAFEAGLSVVRSAVFFVPAGLGVQDLGYIAFLGALGLPDAAVLGTAFVALKRAKEAIWIIIGWSLAGFLALSRARPAARSIDLPKEALP